MIVGQVKHMYMGIDLYCYASALIAGCCLGKCILRFSCKMYIHMLT